LDDTATAVTTPIGVRALTVSATDMKVVWSDQDLPVSVYSSMSSSNKCQMDRHGGPQRPHDGRFYTIRYTTYETDGLYKYVNTTETIFIVTGLRPATQYEFSVKVVFGKQSSSWSMAALNTTDTAPPSSAPRFVAYVHAHTHTV
jgi:neogenin